MDKITKNVEDFFFDYAHALDERDWTLMDEIFTQDAEMYYNNRLFGILIGKKGKKLEIIKWLKSVFKMHGFTSHLISNIHIRTSHTDEEELCDGLVVKASAKLSNYQTIGPFAYFSSGTYEHELIYCGGKLKSRKLYESAGVFAPVLTFENCFVLGGISALYYIFS